MTEKSTEAKTKTDVWTGHSHIGCFEEILDPLDIRNKANEELRESELARQMGLKYEGCSELNAETRRKLQQFCKKWADVLDGLDTF